MTARPPQGARESIALSDARPIWASLSMFLGPLMLSNILQSLSATINSIYLGRLIGVQALAAVSAIFPIIFFLVSFLIGLGSGSTVLIGQAFGARDYARVKEIAGAAIALTLVLGVAVGAFGGFYSHELLAAIGTPPDILAASAGYSRIFFYSIPILFVYLIYTTFLRGTGDARTPLWVLVGGTVLITLFTPAFILGWLGLPRLGVNGAAIANVLGNGIALAGMLVYLKAAKNPLAFDREMLAHVRLPPVLVGKIVRIGVPTAINLVMISLSEIAVITFVNHFGSRATAAYGAVNQVVNYVQFPAVSIGIAASIFGAQAIGAARTERIPHIVHSAVALNYIIEGVLIGICYLISRPLLALFVTDVPTLDIAQSLLHITLWSYVIFGNARVLSGIMLSSGAVVWPTLISICSIWAVEVPVAYVLSHRIGLNGVWYGYPAAYVTGFVLQFAYYKLFWKRRPLQRLA